MTQSSARHKEAGSRDFNGRRRRQLGRSFTARLDEEGGTQQASSARVRPWDTATGQDGMQEGSGLGKKEDGSIGESWDDAQARLEQWDDQRVHGEASPEEGGGVAQRAGTHGQETGTAETVEKRSLAAAWVQLKEMVRIRDLNAGSSDRTSPDGRRTS